MSRSGYRATRTAKKEQTIDLLSDDLGVACSTALIPFDIKAGESHFSHFFISTHSVTAPFESRQEEHREPDADDDASVLHTEVQSPPIQER